MTDGDLIRIERVRLDPLTGRLEGFALCRTHTGQIERHHIVTSGDPRWSHTTALLALRRCLSSGG